MAKRELGNHSEWIIGRGDKCAIRVRGPPSGSNRRATVSRQHARLFVEGGKVLLEDLGSTQGTFCLWKPDDGVARESRLLSHEARPAFDVPQPLGQVAEQVVSMALGKTVYTLTLRMEPPKVKRKPPPPPKPPAATESLVQRAATSTDTTVQESAAELVPTSIPKPTPSPYQYRRAQPSSCPSL